MSWLATRIRGRPEGAQHARRPGYGKNFGIGRIMLTALLMGLGGRSGHDREDSGCRVRKPCRADTR
jgi:hypothetical protein